MSLKTVTITLDNKLRRLRNSSGDAIDRDLEEQQQQQQQSQQKSSTILQQPLSIGENIPFADDSPERPIIQIRSKPSRVYSENRLLNQRSVITVASPSQPPPPTTVTTTMMMPPTPPESSTPPSSSKELNSSNSESSQENVDVLDIKGQSSDETDASTTSNTTREIIPSSAVRFDTETLREMNRILVNLERKATKLNRSLSLNYKNHKGECCCNNNNYRSNIRFSLTKDEKTDKNISKKRQLQDIKNHRRHTTGGNRSIKRRHTVGGTHDYSTTKEMINNDHSIGTPCVVGRSSSPDLVTTTDNLQENCQH